MLLPTAVAILAAVGAVELPRLSAPGAAGELASVDPQFSRFASRSHKPQCATPPQNGAVLEGGTENPLVEFNKLIIENGDSGNAIVKLRDASTNKLFVSFFVAVSGTASYSYIPDGSYVVQYGFGHALNHSCTGFLSTRRAARNPAIETFSAAYSDTRQVLTLKLYPVRRGNLKPQPIDEATFDAQ